MRPKSKANSDLPVHLIRRKRTNKQGQTTYYYFYNGKGTTSKQKEIPLGTDLDEAKIKWAELERKKIATTVRKKDTLGHLFDLYLEKIAPTKALRTQQDYQDEIKQLRKVFDNIPIKAVKPFHIAQYRDARSAKVRANREMSRLSHIYALAIEWGMAEFNPVKGIRKNKEKPRDYYPEDEVFFAVYKHAEQELKDQLMISYLTGQRPADALKVSIRDITDNHLFIGQNKRGHKLRIQLNNDKGRTTLGLLIDDILSRKDNNNPALFTVNGVAMTKSMRRTRFDNARKKAIDEALANNDTELAELIRKFQFRDTRPKAASDMNDIGLASKLLGHTKEEITRKIYIRKGQEVTPFEPQNNH